MTSTNAFDFFSVSVSSEHIRHLTAAGIARKNIQTLQVGTQRYGQNSFPRYSHRATVWCSDHMQLISLDEARAQATKVQAEYAAKGLTASIKYHAID